MSLDNFIRIEAACGFQGNGTVIASRECSVVRNGVGDYTITLRRQIGVGEGLPFVSSSDNNRIVRCTPLTAATCTVLAFDDAGVAADAGVFFMMVRIAP
jgi:hypothetical protein